MTPLPEPAFWETSGFWAGAYVLGMVLVAWMVTRGGDGAARARNLRPVVLFAGGLWVVLHAWAAVEVLAAMSGAAVVGRTSIPRDMADALHSAISASAAAWVLLGATIFAARFFVRSSSPERHQSRVELVVAMAVLVFAALGPVEGRYVGPQCAVGESDESLRTYIQVSWVDRACLGGSLMVLPVAVGVLVAGASLLLLKPPMWSKARRALLDDLAFFGALLIAGALLALEGEAMRNIDVTVLYARSPGGWARSLAVSVSVSPLMPSLAFLGLLAFSFGTLHLRRRQMGAS